MLRVTLHGYPASYSTADGWRCNDGLAERYLRSLSTSEDHPLSEEQALALAVREYGDAVRLDEPDTPDGPHDDDSRTPVRASTDDAPALPDRTPADDDSADRTSRLSTFFDRRTRK
jgi:hypothetical protein